LNEIAVDKDDACMYVHEYWNGRAADKHQEFGKHVKGGHSSSWCVYALRNYWPYNKSVDTELMDNRSEPCAAHTNRQALVASFCGAISRFYTASKTVDAFVIHCLNEAVRLIIAMRVHVKCLHSKMQNTVARLQGRRPCTFDTTMGVRMFSAILDCMRQRKWSRVTHELYCPDITGSGAHAVAGIPFKKYKTVSYSTLCACFHW
jgi:hypothetical protein